MTFTMKEVIEMEARSVWKSVRDDLRLKLTLEEFTFKVNNTEPKRNYTQGELKPVFAKLRQEMTCPPILVQG